MRIRTRVLLGYLPGLLVLLAALFYTLWSWSTSQRLTLGLVQGTIAVTEEVQALTVLARDLNAVEYDYINPFPTRSHSFSSAIGVFDRKSIEFESHVSNLRKVANIGKIKTAPSLIIISSDLSKFLEIDEKMRKAVREGRIRDAERLNYTDSVAAYDRLQEAVDGLFDRVDVELLSEVENARDRRTSAQNRAIGGALVAMLSSLLAGLWQAGRISRPVAWLKKCVEELPRVKIPAPPTDVAQVNELAGLHEAMSRMTTAMTALNEKLARSNENLEHQVAERTASLTLSHKNLEQAVEQMKALDQIKTTFVGTVSHELRTPLSSIMGFTEFLVDEIEGTLTTGQRGFVNQIQDSAKRLTNLVNDLLDFTRLESGRLQIRPEPVDLAELVRECVSSFYPQASGNSINLAFVQSPPAEPLLAEVDRNRISQVIGNLVQNAIKFTPTEGEVVVSLERKGDEAILSVKDNGIGIAEEHQKRLFTRFYQVDPSNTREKGGAGLGLAICKALVEAGCKNGNW